MDAGSPAVEAERYVLSSWLMRSEAVWESLEVLTVADFVEIRHEILAEAIVGLVHESKPTDPIAVIDALTTRKQLDSVGAEYVFELHGYAPTSHNAAYYAEIVHANGRRRALMQAGDVIKALAMDGQLSATAALERARAVVDSAAGTDTSISEVTSDEVIDDVLSKIGVEEPAFRTPWPKLTRAIRGIRPGNLYVIAGRPGLGKSAVALQIAADLEYHGYVGFFSMEMGQNEVTKRLIAQQTELAYAMIDGGKPLPDYAVDRIKLWREHYPGLMLFDDRSGRSIHDIRTQVRTWVRTKPLVAIVIDYLQLMTGDARQNRQEVVAEFSRQAKIMAREFNIAVIALSQLNRGPEQRADKLPAMSDLRESGAIEQDADVIMLLHRDMSLASDPVSQAYIDFIIAKNRQGQTGKIELAWEGEFMRATGGQL